MNSLLQVYYNMPYFVKSILDNKDDLSQSIQTMYQGQIDNDKNLAKVLKRLEESRLLIRELQLLFTNMSIGNKKYADPTNVMRRVTDQNGSMIQIGNEEDIGEYNHNFTLRVQEGLNFRHIINYIIKKKIEKEEKKSS